MAEELGEAASLGVGGSDVGSSTGAGSSGFPGSGSALGSKSRSSDQLAAEGVAGSGGSGGNSGASGGAATAESGGGAGVSDADIQTVSFRSLYLLETKLTVSA